MGEDGGAEPGHEPADQDPGRRAESAGARSAHSQQQPAQGEARACATFVSHCSTPSELLRILHDPPLPNRLVFHSDHSEINAVLPQNKRWKKC